MQTIDFNDTQIAFKARTTVELRKAQALFKTFDYPMLVKTGPKLVELALAMRLPVKPIIRRTLFDHFCGGQTLDDCVTTIDHLARFGVTSILDYSVEGAQREPDFIACAEELHRSIAQTAAHDKIAFSVFKVTGIGRFSLLAKLAAGDKLTMSEKAEYKRVVERVEKLCADAAKRKVRLMIDAEETWIQQPVDDLALEMMRKHNKDETIIYNTVQMYRTDRLDYLDRLIQTGKSEGFHVGAKLVRGAYMEKERDRAEEHGYPSPIQPSKAATDEAFDQAVDLCMQHIDHVGLVCGSHNENSTQRLTEMFAERGIAKDDPRIEFAQLYGMSDHLTYNLAHHGYRVSKYVPYGPIEAVLPYLFRRAEENTSIQGQTPRELQLIETEIERRRKSGG